MLELNGYKKKVYLWNVMHIIYNNLSQHKSYSNQNLSKYVHIKKNCPKKYKGWFKITWAKLKSKAGIQK